MKDSGFTIVELLIVVAIAATLIGIVTLTWGDMTQKSGRENEVRKVYAKLVEVRSQALFRNADRVVRISAGQLKDYPGTSFAGTPGNLSLKYGFSGSPGTDIYFFADGRIAFDSDGTVTDGLVCLDAGSKDIIDSIGVRKGTFIFLGKLKNGFGCTNVDNIRPGDPPA